MKAAKGDPASKRSVATSANTYIPSGPNNRTHFLRPRSLQEEARNQNAADMAGDDIARVVRELIDIVLEGGGEDGPMCSHDWFQAKVAADRGIAYPALKERKKTHGHILMDCITCADDFTQAKSFRGNCQWPKKQICFACNLTDLIRGASHD